MKNNKSFSGTSSAQAPSESAAAIPSPEDLMQQYAALVWKTAAIHLENPEDIKECVNDTFLEFYLHQDHYDPEKGSYAAFLCTIARRKAISMYRKNRKLSGFSVLSGRQSAEHPVPVSDDPENIADPSDMEESLTEHLDLEAALKTLKPEEFDIIRMKYYDGMTIQEIADSLNLSYEAVKKRHQRSLTKLQKALTIGLILAAIAALAACAYVVLRYFGVVPGYGVNTNEQVPFYQLDTAELESKPVDGTSLEIQDARYMNDVLYMEIRLSSDNPEITFGNNSLFVSCGELQPENPGLSAFGGTGGFSGVVGISSTNEDGSLTCKYEIYFPELEALLKEEETAVDAVFSVHEYTSGEPVITEDGIPYNPFLLWRSYELSYSLSLRSLEEDDPENYSYSATEDGGLLLMPCLENGELLVDIYPLNPENGQIFPSLIYCNMLNPEEERVITAEAEDGTVMEGTCLDYNPFTSDAYFTWSFGPAEEGNYTLRIPYLLKKYLLQEDVNIPLSLEKGFNSNEEYQTAAGTFHIGPLESYALQPDETVASRECPLPDYSEQDFYWLLPVQLESARPDEELVFAPFRLSSPETPELTMNSSPEGAVVELDTLRYADDNVLSFLIRVRNQTGSQTQPELPAFSLSLTAQPYGVTSFAMTDMIYTRWNHSFSIPFSVKGSTETASDPGTRHQE